MGEGKKLEVTVEEGNAILQIAANFVLPEKLGGEPVYSVVDRAIAADEVRLLYRELRAYSPLLQAKERWVIFGPKVSLDGKEVWKEMKDNGTLIGYKAVNTSITVSINVSEDIESGIAWCLLVGLHPASPSVRSLSAQEEILWPLVKKMGLTRQLRESIGLVPGKARPTRWKSDSEYDQKDKDKPKEKEAEVK